MRYPRSRAWALVLAASPLLVAAESAASGPAHACIDAHAAGQIERDAGRLRSAQEQFMSCTAEACPAMIRRECVALGESVAAMMPSVVLVAQDTEGGAFEGARATIDGARIIPLLDGRPLELDPGEHRFELGLPDGRRQTLTATLRPAEKYRRIVARFPAVPPPLPPPRATSSGRNPLAYVFGGVGVVALGAWGVYALDGRHKQNALEQCAPHCQAEDVHAMRKAYLIADVLLGVSLVSLGAGTYLFLNHTEEPTTRGEASTVWLGARGRF